MAFFFSLTWNLIEAKSICKVDFGYILTFFEAEVSLVANKFGEETGVQAYLTEVLLRETCSKMRASTTLQRQVKVCLILHGKKACRVSLIFIQLCGL